MDSKATRSRVHHALSVDDFLVVTTAEEYKGSHALHAHTVGNIRAAGAPGSVG